jgi:TatD DNase family protein
MIDVHAHLAFPDFDGDRDEVLTRCRKELSAVIVSSARYDEGLKALGIAKANPGFAFVTLGYHPTDGGTDYDRVLELIRKNENRIVGVGEVGLDYHWEKDLKKRSEQKTVFQEFINLAKELKKPLVIHSWDAEWDCFDMVKDSGLDCVFHCFSGSEELVQQVVDAGFYISMSTHVVFSKHHKKLAKVIPLDRMLLETDSPFLDPSHKKNYPWNIKLSAGKIAEIKGLTKEEVLKAAKENAIRVFGLTLNKSSDKY